MTTQINDEWGDDLNKKDRICFSLEDIFDYYCKNTWCPESTCPLENLTEELGVRPTHDDLRCPEIFELAERVAELVVKGLQHEEVVRKIKEYIEELLESDNLNPFLSPVGELKELLGIEEVDSDD